MRGIFTRKLLPGFSAFVVLSLLVNTEGHAQATTCNTTLALCPGLNISEDFDNSTGDFVPVSGFVYTPAVPPATDGEFRGLSTAASSIFSIRSGTYLVGTGSNTATVGFDNTGTGTAAGNARILSITVNVLNSAGTTILASCTLTPSGNINTFSFCSVIEDNDIQGQTVIFEFIITTFNNQQGTGAVAFDNFRTNLPAGAVTPVDFISFDANKADNGVLLSWKVGNEVNVSHYDAERSSDGVSYTKIGSVAATQSNSYSFTDVQPLGGTSFYRVRNVDKDGQFKYTTVVKYSNGRSEAQLKAFPTTTKGWVTFQHPAVTGRALLTISNLEGRTIRSITLSRGAISTLVDLSAYPTGTYLLRYQGENGTAEAFRVFKQ